MASSLIGKLGAAASAKELNALQTQLKELRDANQQLQETLHAIQTGGVGMRGYLNRHRAPGGSGGELSGQGLLMGLFSQEWELRYYILTGTLLRCYKSERDAAFNPRGVSDVSGCTVLVEDSRGSADQVWRFRVVRGDSSGGNATPLLRLSTDNRQAAQQWVAALEAAGLRIVGAPGCATSDDAPGGASGLLLSDAAPIGSHRTASATAAAQQQQQQQQQQQERWETSSTDSELPELTAAQRAARARGRHPQGAGGSAAASPARGGGGAGISAKQGDGGAATAAAGADTCAAPKAALVRTASTAAGGAASAPEAAAAAASRPPMVGSTPVHTASRYSYLSSDGVWSAKHDGLLNLGMVILVATNFRLILENLLKYGLRLNLPRYVAAALRGGQNLPLLLMFPALLAFAGVALASERLALRLLRAEERARDALAKKTDGRVGGSSSDGGGGARATPDAKRAAAALRARVRRDEALIFGINALNTSAALGAPCAVVLSTRAEPVAGFLLTFAAICLWMKLVSYAHCNADLRAAHRANSLRPGERGAPEADPAWAVLRYPDNLSPRNLGWFLAAPTLCYQVNFPRSDRVRKRWLLRRAAELVLLLGLLLFMVDQWIAPAVANSMAPLREMQPLRIAERVLKLGLPNLYCWLAMFYCLFHLWLNILGELTRFGDREFYKDWWNAATVGDYWKLWNMPVHKWLLRTVYFPAMRAGVPRYWSLVLVFAVSAAFHELAVGVPLGSVNAWAFTGIMMQVPLISITDRLKKRLKSDTAGNLIFWVTFCFLGQPVSLLAYAHDYMFAARTQAAAAAVAAAAAAAAPGALGAAAATIASNVTAAAAALPLLA